jgi:hypothetical protein
VLWRIQDPTSVVQLLSYRSADLLISDHKPVAAVLQTEVSSQDLYVHVHMYMLVIQYESTEVDAFLERILLSSSEPFGPIVSLECTLVPLCNRLCACTRGSTKRPMMQCMLI